MIGSTENMQQRIERRAIEESATSLYSRCAPDSVVWMAMTNKSTGEKVLVAVGRGVAAGVVKEFCVELAGLWGGSVEKPSMTVEGADSKAAHRSGGGKIT